jgi:hypothetical protein
MEPDMRVAILLVLGASTMLAWACAATDLSTEQPTSPTTAKPLSNDCAVIAAIAKEHYKFGPENLPPPLKPGGDEGWTPGCDFSAQGFTFTDYVQPMPGADPRQSLKWVAFQKPVYDGNGAVVLTEIMHGPLAGMGYECRMHSGFAGWTVGECKVSWVS